MSELFASAAKQSDTDASDDQSGLWPEMALPGTAGAPAYRVLARKYRPTNFDQLIGQEAMVRTLTNAIQSGRLPQAWMLTGVRGIGKTTTARIIARALNCTGVDGKGGPTITPCGECNSCRSIAEDRNVDVMEMDAASRTGVDDIRDIIDGVRYGPASARYKIYILDEVHMLSKNAFNALLKTLEEPPPHTKFIFATTEIRKVPVTVLSRCQRFDLRRIDSAMLAAHFTDVAAKEKASIDSEAVNLIAHAADGSVRDGLSLLDQAIARGDGNVSAADVKDMLGLADRGQSLGLCRQLLRGEMRAALETFTAMQQAGTDPVQMLQDLCECVHLLTRAQAIPDFAQDKTLPEYDRQLLTDLADIKVPALARSWQILLKGIGEVQSAPHPADAAEMVLIRLAYAAELPPPADLIRRLRETAAGKDTSNQGTTGAGSAGGIPSPSRGGSIHPPNVSQTFGQDALGARPGVIDGRGASSWQGGSGLTTDGAAAHALPQPLPQGEGGTVALAAHPSPQTYREIVALFDEKREGQLHGQLYGNVHLVRFAPGHLEIRVGEHAPANLAARLGQCLGSWTGQRWMVSITDAEGEPTLAEQDKIAEQKRQDKALAHPLMQATMKAFPGAKLVNLRKKPAVPLPATATNVADDDIADEATPISEPEDDQ
jgi:DNA polymerase-3 subunit gamma/tau